MASPPCRPAVPPPPVAGAPKFGLCVWVGGCVVGLTGVAGFEVVAVAPGVVAGGLCVAGAEVLAGAEVCVAGVVAGVSGWLVPGAAAGPEVALPVGVAVPDGEKIAGTLDPGAPVHAETVAETRTIKVAQLRTVRCAFMNPP